jgi:hypothetical protein
MKNLTYKNVTRFSLPVVIKTADGAKTVSFNLAPNKTFDMLETQVTGDVKVKTKNGLLKLVSEKVGFTTTTKFLTVPKAAPKNSVFIPTLKLPSTKNITITTKEKG